jgi:1-acyl-sn-glycerol-3-phosphate acyltransferase
VDGYENITDDSPKIYAANHQSFVDILVLAATLPGKFRWIAKKELFRIPFLGWHMQRAKYISIDRSDRASAARSIMETVETLRRGISLVIFPEETRSPDGNLKEFKRGGFAVAVRAEVPIVPVVIEGTAGVLKRGDLRVHKADVYVRILKPLKPPLKKSKTAELELMESTRDAILKSLSEIRGT